jgi:hypothetical protein
MMPHPTCDAQNQRNKTDLKMKMEASSIKDGKFVRGGLVSICLNAKNV